MATIQVRDLPEEIYTKLAQLAKAEHRSLAQETIVVLKKALDLEEDRKRLRDNLLKKIKKKKSLNNIPDPVSLIRQDRER